jgi:hypothetical protein
MSVGQNLEGEIVDWMVEDQRLACSLFPSPILFLHSYFKSERRRM